MRSGLHRALCFLVDLHRNVHLACSLECLKKDPIYKRKLIPAQLFLSCTSVISILVFLKSVFRVRKFSQQGKEG